MSSADRMEDKRTEARAYTPAEGEDAPEIRDWAWPA
jgi:phosphoketolase